MTVSGGAETAGAAPPVAGGGTAAVPVGLRGAGIGAFVSPPPDDRTRKPPAQRRTTTPHAI